MFIIMGDFNSHSQSWGYDHIRARGEEIEAWQYDNNLTLINQPYDTPTLYSRCWQTISTTDIALCTEDLHSITMREVGDQLGGSAYTGSLVLVKFGRMMGSSGQWGPVLKHNDKSGTGSRARYPIDSCSMDEKVNKHNHF